MIAVKKANQVYRVDEKDKQYYLNRGFKVLAGNEAKKVFAEAENRAKLAAAKPADGAQQGGNDHDDGGGA